MCIASFVLDREKFILTFNRDENSGRKSLPPEFRTQDGLTVLCPIDTTGGGTWIGYNETIAACLQNGAFIKHHRKPPYSKSRGLILMDILTSSSYENGLDETSLTGVEPFTLSIFDINRKNFTILRYDGEKLHEEKKNLSAPEIIASCTLYGPAAQTTIKDDFMQIEKTPEHLFRFHSEYRIGGTKNKFTDLVPTVSVTQMIVEEGRIFCTYMETETGKTSHISQ